MQMSTGRLIETTLGLGITLRPGVTKAEMISPAQKWSIEQKGIEQQMTRLRVT